jgi:16S rRNA (cytosine1402-N4)-methyltransferase
METREPNGIPEFAEPVRDSGYHVPVMREEVLELFGLAGGRVRHVLDCTLGAGGHAEAILEAAPQADYLGIDADPEARARASARLARFAPRLRIEAGYFDEVLETLAAGGAAGPQAFDFILFDLGLSLHSYRDSGRGFSFSQDEALDMRLSPDADATAADLIARLREEELADLIFQNGEERYSRRIARAIVERRKRSPVRTSGQLAEIVMQAVPPAYRHGRIHPATRTFQALRIAVNDELGRERRALDRASTLLSPGGILVVISFHSLEDRIAKQLCKDRSRNAGFIELYKTPRLPTEAECAKNPASRSAKLRALRAPGALAESGPGSGA